MTEPPNKPTDSLPPEVLARLLDRDRAEAEKAHALGPEFQEAAAALRQQLQLRESQRLFEWDPLVGEDAVPPAPLDPEALRDRLAGQGGAVASAPSGDATLVDAPRASRDAPTLDAPAVAARRKEPIADPISIDELAEPALEKPHWMPVGEGRPAAPRPGAPRSLWVAVGVIGLSAAGGAAFALSQGGAAKPSGSVAVSAASAPVAAEVAPTSSAAAMEPSGAASATPAASAAQPEPSAPVVDAARPRASASARAAPATTSSPAVTAPATGWRPDF